MYFNLHEIQPLHYMLGTEPDHESNSMSSIGFKNLNLKPTTVKSFEITKYPVALRNILIFKHFSFSEHQCRPN